MAILQKNTPVQSNLTIPLTESKARLWVQALPLTDPGETTRRLFHGLVDMNRRSLPAVTRLHISDMLRPVMEVSLENLQRHLQARAFPLSGKSQKIFELQQSLLLEFVGSYQVAALDMLTKQEGGKKTLHTAIYRAMEYMERALLTAYSVYVRTRETIWHDIHHLYLLASEQGIERLAFKEADGAPNTIESRYVLMNLLALARPYSLRQGEVERVKRYFIQNLALVSVSREPEGQVGDYVHAAILNSDEPAVLMPVGDLPHSPTVRVLNLHTLVAHIDAYIRQLESRETALVVTPDSLNRNLAKRLTFNLTAIRNRSFNRFPKDEKIGMVSRMADVLAVIQNAQKNDPLAELREDDMLFNVFAIDDDEEEDGETAGKPSADPTGACVQTWKVMNSSVGGYGLCWPYAEMSGARVGEIVALRDMANEDSVWMIGVIKWMEFMNGKGLCCGVELLSTKAMPLSVLRVTNRLIQQKLPMEGLMLPSIGGTRPDPALVLPAYVFQVGDELRLHFADREERIKLIVVDECLGAFAYCRFSNLHEAKGKAEEEDFTQLWKTL